MEKKITSIEGANAFIVQAEMALGENPNPVEI